MSVLLEEIRGASQDAAAALEKAGSVSDTDIKMLTRQDLSELIPGAQHFRLRKTIGDIIQNVKPINAVLRERLDFIPDDRVKVILNLLRVLRELLDFIPDDRVKAALTKNGVLNDLMKTKVESVLNGVLNDLMKTKVESVHSFLEALLEAHIGLFEEYAEKREKGRPASSSVDFEPRCAPVERQSHGQGSVADQRTVRVEPIVKGKTFDCHRTLLQHVRKLGGLHVEETASGPKVVVVFCPVSNRYRTDIEAAMKDVVPGGAAVILVVMHHTHDIDYPNIVRSLDGDRCWDFVNVLYHDSVPGLLTCVFNEQAVAQLRGMLLKHSSVVCPVAAAAPSPDAAAAAAAAATAAAPSPFAATHGQAGPASLSVDCAPVKCDSSSQTDDYVQGEMRTILPEPVTNVRLLLPARPASSSVDFEPRCAPVERQSHGQGEMRTILPEPVTNVTLLLPAQPASSSVDFEPRCAPVERQSHGQGSVADQRTVRVESIVKGQTYDCHRTLLQRVRQLGGLHVEETTSGPKVVVVFCPVTSCYRKDIKEAMKDVVPGGAAVILVVMHHTHDIDYPNIVRSLGDDRCWDLVNVLYHETVPGLLTCTFNEQAVAQLRSMLLKHSSATAAAPSPVDASAAAPSVSGSYGGGSKPAASPVAENYGPSSSGGSSSGGSSSGGGSSGGGSSGGGNYGGGNYGGGRHGGGRHGGVSSGGGSSGGVSSGGGSSGGGSSGGGSSGGGSSGGGSSGGGSSGGGSSGGGSYSGGSYSGGSSGGGSYSGGSSGKNKGGGGSKLAASPDAAAAEYNGNGSYSGGSSGKNKSGGGGIIAWITGK